MFIIIMYANYCTGSESPMQSFRYTLKIINPRRKSEVSTQTWHNVHDKFTSPDLLRKKIIASYTEQVPDSDNFEIGYYEKPGNSKRWIISAYDLKAMYSTSARDNSIILWCDARAEPSSDGSSKKKRSYRDDGREELTSKRARRERDIVDIFETLREKHSVGEYYSDPQLRLWARMYANGSHSDLDHPPQVPAITGQVCRQKTSNRSLTEALAGAATAVTKILAPGSPSKVAVQSLMGYHLPVKLI